MARPWFKFSPTSWRGEPKLRMCSLSARGLWIDLLSYMAEGEPYGHFLIEGKQPNLEQTASLVGRPLKEVKSAFAELESNGVFSRREDAAIFSRRMVRDKAKEETDKANGKWGGNPKLREPDNGGVNPPDKAKSLEGRIQNPESKQDARGLVDFRSRIVRAFETANSPSTPDTSHVSVWLALGYDQELCVAIVAEGIAKKPSVSTLKYFDNQIKEAHEKRAGINGHHGAEELVEAPADREKRWKAQIQYWTKHHKWIFRGPDPESPHCEIPKEKIQEWSRQQA